MDAGINQRLLRRVLRVEAGFLRVIRLWGGWRKGLLGGGGIGRFNLQSSVVDG